MLERRWWDQHFLLDEVVGWARESSSPSANIFIRLEAVPCCQRARRAGWICGQLDKLFLRSSRPCLLLITSTATSPRPSTLLCLSLQPHILSSVPHDQKNSLIWLLCSEFHFLFDWNNSLHSGRTAQTVLCWKVISCICQKVIFHI